MKITSLGNRESLVVNNDKGLKGVKEPVEFAKTLHNVGQKEYQEDLERLISEIDKRAEKLAQTRTLNELKNYKRAVRDFLNRTIRNAYLAQDETSWDRLGRQKVHVLVKKVDENLEELSRQVLSEQTESLNILEKLDEIRGMLVDMYL
ncbi:MAG: YaaR family protein [Peptococcales bacterium]|jgi:uncharacterized protein YaaR (DUF327 family)